LVTKRIAESHKNGICLKRNFVHDGDTAGVRGAPDSAFHSPDKEEVRMIRRLNGRPPQSRFDTLGARLVILFCAITIPLLLILYFGGNYATGVVLAQVSNSYQNLVNSNMSVIDKSLDDITKNMVNIVNNDESFQKFGRPGLTDSEKYFTQIDIIHREVTYQTYYHTVDMIFIYSRPNDQLNTTDMFGAASNMKETVRTWIAAMFQDPAKVRSLMYKWSVVRIEGRYFLIRLVSDDIANQAYIGSIISADSLSSLVGDLDLKEDGDLLFTDDQGTVISSLPASLESLRRLPAPPLRSNRPFSLSYGGSKLLVVTGQSDLLGMRMAVILPRSQLLRGLSEFQTFVRILPIAIFGMLLLYLWIFRSFVVKPIQQLLGGIRRIREGQLGTRLPESPIREFAIINRSFNEMAGEITDLKIDVYEGRLRSQKAEMKQLQLQINPHFFLNTLNIIFQLADLRRTELVKKTVRHLVQYFRFMLRTNQDFIRLDEELAHLSDYLELQKLRFQESFEYRIRVTDELGQAVIPSLLVQPLVENAMIHGMSVKHSPFQLEIEACRIPGDPDRMILEVRDNGRGISEERLAELNDPDYAPASDGSHIGIWNVKKRLQMGFGGRASIRFAPHQPQGTCVRIELPVSGREGNRDE
jgi:two-component system sensor histidine kinase YesM